MAGDVETQRMKDSSRILNMVNMATPTRKKSGALCYRRDIC